MESSARSRGDVMRWHTVMFSAMAGLLVLLALLGGAGDLLLLPGQSGFPSAIHRWHEAQSGALAVILLAGSLLALIRRPQRRPLLLQYLVLSIGVLCVAFAAASGAGFSALPLVVGLVLSGILVAAYPRPADVLDTTREGPLSYPLLGITCLAAFMLAPVIARELNYQVLGMAQQDEHARNYHWLTSVGLALLLILGGALAATRRPGWHPLGFIVGIAYIYLGAIALLLPGYVGSWGPMGGVIGLLGGVSYIGVTVLEARRARNVARMPSLKTNAPVQETVESASEVA